MKLLKVAKAGKAPFVIRRQSRYDEAKNSQGGPWPGRCGDSRRGRAAGGGGLGHGPDWAGGTPGQWSMAGQNIYDTNFQAAKHEISSASAGRLAPRWTLTTADAISAIPKHH